MPTVSISHIMAILFLINLCNALSDYHGISDAYFAWFGQEVRLMLEQMQDSWVQLTLGHGTQEHTFAIELGYVVVAISLAFYLNIITA